MDREGREGGVMEGGEERWDGEGRKDGKRGKVKKMVRQLHVRKEESGGRMDRGTKAGEEVEREGSNGGKEGWGWS